MKKRLTVVIALSLIWALVGCSSFYSVPQMARIHVRGPGNQAREFVISLEDLTAQENMDIRLSDRYAINLDLQWLWYEKEDLNTEEFAPDPLNVNLAPWILCKYRF